MKVTRRDFVQTGMQAAAGLLVGGNLLGCSGRTSSTASSTTASGPDVPAGGKAENLAAFRRRLNDLGQKMEQITLYHIDVKSQSQLSHSTWTSRQHLFMRFSGGGQHGWTESRISSNEPSIDVKAWSQAFAELKGLPLGDALEHVYQNLYTEGWGRRRCEIAELALFDLAGKLEGTPAVEMLGLEGRAPVPGLFTVLDRDPERLRQKAIAARQDGMTHLKVKLFGEADLDRRLAATAREVMGPDAVVVGDVNRGYRTEQSEAPVTPIAEALRRIHAAGIDACEDPARMSIAQWVALQQQVGDLDLIPDYPMRPARKALEIITPGMGRLFNFHPDTTGSLVDVVQLAEKIRGFGSGIMIGDDSFVGPGATQWQQLAIGLKANWVEALEKPDESNIFQRSVDSTVTELQPDGAVRVASFKPGFGMEIDAQRLGELATAHARL